MATLTEDKQHVHQLIERLEPGQLPMAARFIEFLLLDPTQRSAAIAPLDDELVTVEEAAAIQRSEAWFEQNHGNGIPMEEVLADFGLTMEDFPLKQHGA